MPSKTGCPYALNLRTRAEKNFHSREPPPTTHAAHLSSPPTYPHHIHILATTLTVLSTERRPPGTQGECKGHPVLLGMANTSHKVNV